MKIDTWHDVSASMWLLLRLAISLLHTPLCTLVYAPLLGRAFAFVCVPFASTYYVLFGGVI